MKTYAFIIKRDQHYPAGYANGYVAVVNTHPLYGKKYSDMVEVEDIDSVPYNGNVFGLLINVQPIIGPVPAFLEPPHTFVRLQRDELCLAGPDMSTILVIYYTII